MPFVTRPHAEIYYESYGTGAPIVFAHGAGGNTLVWFQQVAQFARQQRVIVFDHRGFGRSRCDADQQHARYFPGDLGAILDDAGVSRAALVCQSMGGWTGLHFALAHPQRVSALVLSGTPAGLQTPKVIEALAAVARTLAAASEQTPRWDEPHPALAPDAFVRDPNRTILYAQIGALNPPGAVLRANLFEMNLSAERLTGWNIPTLVVGGKHDRLFSPVVLREVAQIIPGARFHEIPTVGHSPYFEAPEEFNRVVGDFLDASV